MVFLLGISLTKRGLDMNIDKQIEFDKVKEIWAELAITDYAKEQIRETTICLSEYELRKLLRDTTSAKEMIENDVEEGRA